MKQGFPLKMKAVARTLDLKDSMDLEMFFIKKYRKLGFTLYNLTAGGDDKKKIKINRPKTKSVFRNKKKFKKKRR